MKIKTKKILTVNLILFLTFFALTSCKAKHYNTTPKIQVTASIFPIFDWVNNLSYPENNEADKIALNLLVKNGVDLHSYQATTTDIVQICNSDVFIYVGGPSDKWVDDALKNSTKPDQIVIKLMDVLKDYIQEESEEGIVQGENSQDTQSKAADNSTGDRPLTDGNLTDASAVEYDEHVWLSVKNAVVCCKAITEALCKVNPEWTELYQSRLENYLNRLNLLDIKYETAISTANKDTIIICDRFPFRYLTSDYNLKYYAAFSGCSAETEASFETVALLSQKVDEINPKVVFTIDSSNQKLAKTVLYNSSHKFLDIETLDSMQSITLRDAFNGKTYIKIMETNLEKILKGLE